MTGVAVSALLAGAAMSPAVAADVYSQDSLKDSPSFAQPVRTVNWSGFYIGGEVGYGNANHDLSIQRYNNAYCFDKSSLPSDFDSTDLYEYNGDAKVNHTNYTKAFKVSEDGCNDGDTLVDANTRNLGEIDGFNSHGVFGGAQIGLDKQVNRFVFGVFGSYGISGMETKISGGTGPFNAGIGSDASYSLEKKDEWSVGARAGVLVNPKTLVYILAAYTETEYELNGLSQAERQDGWKNSNTFTGISVGGGIEYALTNNIFMGMEYRHLFASEETWFDGCNASNGGECLGGTRVLDDLDEDKIMATLKIKLNSGLFGN